MTAWSVTTLLINRIFLEYDPKTNQTSEKQQFLPFRAKGNGKTTLLRGQFATEKNLWIDLLDPNTEDRLLKNPSMLSEQVAALGPEVERIVFRAYSNA